jgi:hypothetical protein
MDILFTTDLYHQHILKYAELNPDTVFIATFGLYAGILDDGRDVTSWTTNKSHEILDIIEAHCSKVYVLVGIPSLIFCDKGKKCVDCVEKYIKYCDRIVKTAQHWPSFKWKFSQNNHSKYCGFMKSGKPIGAIVGGRNFTDSDWADVSFDVTNDIGPLFKNFLCEFKTGYPIVQKYLNKHIEQCLTVEGYIGANNDKNLSRSNSEENF